MRRVWSWTGSRLVLVLAACAPATDGNNSTDSGSSADGAVVSDAGSSTDGGALITDGGSITDSAVTMDGATPTDGGSITDGAVAMDGATPSDGGSITDGGGTADADSGLPACRLGQMPTAAVDLPDDRFVDANCDGVDGDAASAIFVATDGDDSAAGTWQAPVATVQAGIERAALRGLKQVYVSEGTYREQVVLRDGIAVYGGYSRAAQWARAANYQVVVIAVAVTGDLVAMRGADLVQPTIVDRVRLETALPLVPGVSTYGLQCIRCSGLVVRNTTIRPNAASAGRDGLDGGPGRNGVAGENGRNGNRDNYLRLGFPGDSGRLTDVTAPRDTWGGVGGIGGGRSGAAEGSCDSGNGATGFNGQGGALGGAGGRWGPVGQPGADGANGLPGASGRSGAAGIGGTVRNGFWVGRSGTDGARGTNGAGGGGGGGGGGQVCPIVRPICGRISPGTCLAGAGNGGGGGGNGGVAGEPGTGGQAGGSSFGMFLAFSPGVTLDRVTIQAGPGGRGGRGGRGALGAAGGAGGLGGPDGTNEVGKGGNGGSGGAAGASGHGGGGAGGASVALAAILGSTGIDRSTTSLTPGLGGPPGPAETGDLTGSEGISAAFLDFFLEQ